MIKFELDETHRDRIDRWLREQVSPSTVERVSYTTGINNVQYFLNEYKRLDLEWIVSYRRTDRGRYRLSLRR